MDSELLVNCRNHKTAEVPISAAARLVRCTVPDPAIAARGQLREEALERLQARAGRDEVVADLLTVLGLV